MFQARICYLSSVLHKPECVLWGMVATSPINIAVPARSLLPGLARDLGLVWWLSLICYPPEL